MLRNLQLTRQTGLFQQFHKIVSLNVSKSLYEFTDEKVRLLGFEVFEHVSTRTIFRGKLALFCNVLWQVKCLAEFFKEMHPVLDQRQFLPTMTD